MKSEISPAREHSSRPVCRYFRQQLSSTERGARLARLLAVQQLVDWGWDRDGEAVAGAALVDAELSANAVVHGRVPGRDFLLALALTAATDGVPASLRIEVTDARGELLPSVGTREEPWDEYGRGLLIVQSLAARWGTVPRPPSGKTVWAVLEFYGGGGAPGPGHEHSGSPVP